MSFINREKNNKLKKIIIFLVVITIALVLAFVFLSPAFEKNAPKVSLKNDIYWNLKTPLEIDIYDDYEIKSYSITYNDGENEFPLETKVISENKNTKKLNILAPKLDRKFNAKNITLKINVFDNSKWNFFRGNELNKNINVKIDRKKPIANVVNNSYLIRQGGSASLVVEVKDENLKDLYVSFNNELRFELFPFYKENFYASIIAWPIEIEEFKRVNLIAIDKAGNKTTTKIPYYIKSKKVKIDKLKISDNFINKVSKNVLTKSGLEIPDSQADVFIMANQTLRAKNVKTIKDVVIENLNFDMISKFNIKAFRQLKGSKTFAGYGERRHYFYDGEKIDEAWHLGMDWASIRKAKIYTSNEGKVIFKDYLGIYGNTTIIDHGFGLSSLYAHASKLNVEVGDSVYANQLIANTGSTGAVFGDHLHFGVLIQGIEINPIEWLDRKWIRENITKILNQSKKAIDSK